jgi:predicted DNA-binding transcriptional regulator YafY
MAVGGRVGKARHFEVITTVLALAEERAGGVELAEAATAVGLAAEQVKELLEPVLYLEFRDDRGEIVDETRAFLFTEDGRVVVTDDHWLRSMAARPPSALTALRLLAAGTVMQRLLRRPSADLASGLAKLDAHLQRSVVIPVERPPLLDVCEQARREGVTLVIDYTADTGVASHREIEPWHVVTNWGKWYVQGPEVDDAQAVPKWWRVDRMTSARQGERAFGTPPPLDMPEAFDLGTVERTVRLRLDRETLDNLPQPHRVDDLSVVARRRDGAEVLEVTITVIGDHRLAHLLVAAGPGAEVVGSAELDALRRAHAAALLEHHRAREAS